MASTENKGKATGAYSSVLSRLINYSDPLSTSKLVTSELSVCLSKSSKEKKILFGVLCFEARASQKYFFSWSPLLKSNASVLKCYSPLKKHHTNKRIHKIICIIAFTFKKCYVFKAHLTLCLSSKFLLLWVYKNIVVHTIFKHAWVK